VSKENEVERKDRFIDLSLPQCGPVLYGYGSGAYHIKYRGEILVDFLGRLRKKMEKLASELNQAWKALDKANPESPRNRDIIQKMLQAGFWAYAQTLEIQIYNKECVYGITSPLHDIIVNPLENIYMRCFAAAHMWGDLDEKMLGLNGLLTDFEVNGGIDHKTGDKGNGFGKSLLDYYIAYFAQNQRGTEAYLAFGELIDALFQMTKKRYPKILTELAKAIRSRMTETYYGFGNKEVTSPAKVALLSKLEAITQPYEEKEKAA